MQKVDEGYGDILAVSDFVALVNQTMGIAFPVVSIRGELAEFKVSKNKWVYFALKDDIATVRFFGTVYQLNGPLENGMMLLVRGTPKLHERYGFSVTVLHLRPEGEGTLRRAADLLRAKLDAEGLFEVSRKRPIPYPPETVGLITSRESAAYADFVKVINSRWGGVAIASVDVQVQGDAAPEQIVRAIEYFNSNVHPPDVIVVIRGGGSAEDLYAYSTEQVTRAIAGSRVPTVVAVGHEIDVSLAELAADLRASTPSNAAELLVPDRAAVLLELQSLSRQLRSGVTRNITTHTLMLSRYYDLLHSSVSSIVDSEFRRLNGQQQLIEALSPKAILRRGYAIVRIKGRGVIRSAAEIAAGDIVDIEMSDGHFQAKSSTRKGGKT